MFTCYMLLGLHQRTAGRLKWILHLYSNNTFTVNCVDYSLKTDTMSMLILMHSKTVVAGISDLPFVAVVEHLSVYLEHKAN